jgi:hypothetical protein
MSEILISSGDKGGTGKSMVSAVAVDRKLSAGESVALLEGDEGQPDIALRFARHTLVQLGAVNLNRAGDSETAVTLFGEWIEQQSHDVIVNLPSAAGDTLDNLADVIVGVCRDLGHNVQVAYSLGMHRTSSDGLRKSLAHGLMGAVPATNRLVVYPEFLGRAAAFDWSKTPDRVTYLSEGGRETVMPALRPDVLRDKVLALPGSFTDLLVPSAGLSLTERMMFQRWLHAAHAALAGVVGVTGTVEA